MHSHSDGNTPRVPDSPDVVTPEPAEVASPEPPAGEAAAAPEAPPSNAFAAEFLGRLEERDDEPPAAVEADYAGPWRMARLPDGRIGLFRLRQRPFAWFRERHDALLTAAVLAARRDPGYRVRAEEGGEGYAVESRAEWGETVGWVECFDPDLAAGLSWADAFMRSPEALALFLEACGQAVLERAGEILEARVRQSV